MIGLFWYWKEEKSCGRPVEYDTLSAHIAFDGELCTGSMWELFGCNMWRYSDIIRLLLISLCS